MKHYTILDGSRAAIRGLRSGQLAYSGNDCFGLASTDTRILGIEHTSLSLDPTGTPTFTIPDNDFEQSEPFGYAGIPDMPIFVARMFA